MLPYNKDRLTFSIVLIIFKIIFGLIFFYLLLHKYLYYGYIISGD